MARIALGITLAFLLATCFFGFQTRSKILGLNDQVAGLTTNLADTKQNLAKTTATLKTTQNDLATAKADDEATKSQLATVQTNLDAATKQVTDLTAQIADRDAQIKTLKASTGTTGPAIAPGPGVDVDKLNAQLKDAQAQIAELNTVKDSLTEKAKDAESRADELQKKVDYETGKKVRNGLEGEVLAVNQGWNFVVLSIGDRQGAVNNAEMILKRGGNEIGKVRITSVEPSTSVADIIPGSLARGVRVQPGDRVIFPGS